MIQGVLKSVPGVILNIFITVFSMYYFLKHGKDLYKFFSELIPLPEGRHKQILLRFDDLSRGMIMGQVVVGLIQGFTAPYSFIMGRRWKCNKKGAEIALRENPLQA